MAELAPSLVRKLRLGSIGTATSPRVMGPLIRWLKDGDPYTTVTLLLVHFPQQISLDTHGVPATVCVTVPLDSPNGCQLNSLKKEESWQCEQAGINYL